MLSVVSCLEVFLLSPLNKKYDISNIKLFNKNNVTKYNGNILWVLLNDWNQIPIYNVT
jgi:hypothetical protein